MSIPGIIRFTALALLLPCLAAKASYQQCLTEQTLDGSEPIANVLRHSYDALNRLISTSDNIGPVQSMDYDANGNPIELTDALGQVTTQQFDGLDRLIRQTLPEARVVRMDYNVHGELISQTDARDFTTSFSYNTLGQQTVITHPDSSSEAFEYDLVGNRTASIDANNQRSSFEYDALNRMISQTDPADDTGNSSSQSFNYDLQGNLIRQTDRNGNVTDNSYDLENRLQTSTREDILQLTQVYDDVGNLRRSTDANNHTTVNDYDAANALIREIRPRGAVTTLTRDALGNVVTEQRPAGRNITRSFDARGRVLTETNHAQETTSFDYDDNDNLIQTTRPNGGVWQRDYDTANRLIGITDPEQNHWSYGYDQNDNRSSHTDANGHTTTQDYDNRNRLISISYPDTSTATFTYDATGNLRTSTDANAQTTTHDYDQRNRRIHTSYSGASGDAIASIDFSYDANSNLTQVELTSASGEQRTSLRQYDAFDRPEIITDRFGNRLQYGYDANGNRRQLIDHNNRVTQYGYDELNRLRSINAPLAGQVVYDYYNNSQLRQIDWPNGIRSHYQYDGAERIASIQHQLAASSFAEAQYDYDLNGNRSQQIITQGTQSEQTSYDYDTADRLTQINEPNRSIDYTLDGVANRLTETITDNNQTTTQDKTYSYNSRDQLQQVQDAIGGALISYQYDNNGNQISKTDASGTTNLVYGPRDRLLTITLPGAPPIAYSYNEAGLRDSQSQNGQTLHYIYDQTSLIAETNTTGNELARYTHSSVGLIAEARSGVQTYLHTDALSTPIAITDTTGAVTTRYTWDTWGNLQQQTGVSQQPFGFTGYQRDEQTGLHYAQQRYYDAEIGRFNRHDPFRGEINTPLSLHRYLYANANPTIFVDPDGREACIGAALINCPVDQFIANNRSVPVQISEQAFAGVPETTAVAADRSEQLVSLPPPQQVFTRNFRLVPQVDPEGLDGVIAFNAVALDNGEGQFRIAPRDLDAFIRDEEKFRNVAAFNETVGGNRPVNIHVQRAMTEFFNRALLGQEPDRSIIEEVVASFGEAARDPVFLTETAAGFVGGVALKSGRLPVDARVVQQSQVTRGGALPNQIGRVGEDLLQSRFGGQSRVVLETSQGRRVIDNLAEGVARESKVGRVSMSPRLRSQILKDSELLRTRQIDAAEFQFFRSPVTGKVGPTPSVERLLQECGIGCVINP